MTRGATGSTGPTGPCGGRASVVCDPSLAAEAGVLDGLEQVPAPMASDDLIATVHDVALIEAVQRMGARPGPGEELRGLGTDDNPVFLGMHHAAAHIVGAS